MRARIAVGLILLTLGSLGCGAEEHATAVRATPVDTGPIAPSEAATAPLPTREPSTTPTPTATSEPAPRPTATASAAAAPVPTAKVTATPKPASITAAAHAQTPLPGPPVAGQGDLDCTTDFQTPVDAALFERGVPSVDIIGHLTAVVRGDEQNRQEGILGCLALEGFIYSRSSGLRSEVELGFTSMPVFLLVNANSAIFDQTGQEKAETTFQEVVAGQSIGASFVAPVQTANGLNGLAIMLTVHRDPGLRGRITSIGRHDDVTGTSIFVEAMKSMDSRLKRASVSIRDGTRIYVGNGAEHRVTVDYLKVGQIVEVQFAGILMTSDPPSGLAFEVTIVDRSQ